MKAMIRFKKKICIPEKDSDLAEMEKAADRFKYIFEEASFEKREREREKEEIMNLVGEAL